MRFYSNIYFESQGLQRILSEQRLVDLIKAVAGPDIWIRWDQAVAKGSGSGEFPWHQDNGYNSLKVEHFQLWIALSTINDERGGLRLVPGSHKNGVLPHVAVGNHMTYRGPMGEPVSVEAEAGDMILFSSLLLHYTCPNVSPYDRWAYVVEYMSMSHYDPFIHAPYFIVAENGVSKPHFTNTAPGSRSLEQQALYVLPRLKHRARVTLRRVLPPAVKQRLRRRAAPDAGGNAVRRGGTGAVD